jgi:predicted MPP superfamily phosphohydrolase
VPVPRPRKRPESALARQPQLVEHEVRLPGLDARHDGVRVAHLTDVHCGRLTPATHIRKAVALANAARPDFVVMTGDYVCFSRREIPLIEQQLSGLRAREVFVTLGNHDYWASGRFVAAAMRANGYTVLRNEHRTMEHAGAQFHVVGIDDPVTRRHDVPRAFSAVPEAGTRLVLCHCPEQVDAIAAHGAHLMLSGHTHGGQINLRGVTDRLLRNMGRRYLGGFYAVDRTLLYVSPGVGFSGIRVRVGRGTRAEVAVFTLRAANTEAS